MQDLLGAVTAVVMPVDTLYAKVDMPYVLLEAMQTPLKRFGGFLVLTLRRRE